MPADTRKELLEAARDVLKQMHLPDGSCTFCQSTTCTCTLRDLENVIAKFCAACGRPRNDHQVRHVFVKEER